MTQDTRSALLRAALDAAERGWPVLPLRPGGKRPAGHGEDHCPRTGRCAAGHRTPEQRATTCPDTIRAAWALRPWNVAIATGPAGLLVVDLDTLKPKDEKGTPCGATSFQALCERAGQAVPVTYRVRTPNGGEHLYFTAPDGARLKSSAGRLAKKIDIRAWGGYVVAPGSTTTAGAYEVADSAPVAPLPGWLAGLLTERPAPTGAPVIAVPRDASRVAGVALERECAAVAATGEGGRNSTLYRAALKVGRFVAWGDLPRHVVEEAFQAAGESTGLPPAECRTTIRSALNWSTRTARAREAA
ncbi:bifunctional DNA primase/polymerase [Streptomyces sp. WAC 00631]|uniref:bifunctional DNA primase/polymerase n=1 Tax=Streptomyces sp. WAC 00631 TaxID=2203201 RepID=UPI000F7B6BD4|nr:bifunctional DNA primase/polymerase [Streptomyces sp. WAC 00631]MCC5032294.1 bifunctional DNA primase/polymerase [Streptomyces sp. WAC 00631]